MIKHKPTYDVKWKDVKPSGHYVYIHLRSTDSVPFYVGRGQGRRAWDYTARNRFWTFTALKHGVSVKILKDNMSESCSNSLEIMTINYMRKRGIKICNISDGGEGSTGSPSSQKKKTFASNGMVFESTLQAADWVSNNIRKGASFSAIAASASGRIFSAYGLAWSYESTPDYIHPSVRRASAFGVGVICSNGMKFDSMTKAANWCRENGFPSASAGKISMCVNGKRRKAYGFDWSAL